MLLQYVLLACIAFQAAHGIDLPEGSQVALEAGGLLVPDQELVRKVTFELNSIRRVYQQVGDIFHQRKWIPGELIFYGNANSPENRGKFARLNASRFGTIQIRKVSNDRQSFFIIEFQRPYEPEILSSIISREFGLDLNPNTFIGRSLIIEYNRFRREYLFSRGSGDCAAGCTHWQRYLFREYNDGYIYLVWQSGVKASGKGLELPYTYVPSSSEDAVKLGQAFKEIATDTLKAAALD